MTKYVLNGISLDVPEEIQTAPIRKMLEKGWYEIEEVRAIRAHLLSTDSVLELGGGIGYLAAFCAQLVGANRVTTVEANPILLPVIEETLSNCGLADVNILHGVAVEKICGKTENFYISDAFWSGTRKKSEDNNYKKIVAPALALKELIKISKPTILIVDIEGAEEDFFYSELPSELRLIIIELHPSHYPSNSIKNLFLRLFDQGFIYETKGSHGAVVVFKR